MVIREQALLIIKVIEVIEVIEITEVIEVIQLKIIIRQNKVLNNLYINIYELNSKRLALSPRRVSKLINDKLAKESEAIRIIGRFSPQVQDNLVIIQLINILLE